MECKFVESKDTSIGSQLLDFFYDNEDFALFFENWCKDRCSVIDLSTEENKLEYTWVYRDFIREFEDQLTTFIDSRGSSTKELYEELRKAKKDSEMDVFAQVINATTDYDVFMSMMRDMAKQQQQAQTESKT